MCFLSEVSKCRITFNKQNFYITNSKPDSPYYPVYSVLVWLFHGYDWVLTRTHIQTDKHVKNESFAWFLSKFLDSHPQKMWHWQASQNQMNRQICVMVTFCGDICWQNDIFSTFQKKNSICTLFCLFCLVTDLFRRYCSRIYRWQNGDRTTDQCSLIFICRIALKITIDVFTFSIISWMWLHPSR